MHRNLIAALAIYALSAAPAHAHSWYDRSCCSDQDCHPVPDGSVTETKDGVVVKGWGIMSETDPRLRWSQDDQDHLCESKPGPAALGKWASTPKLLCVYRKRKDM